eukprot:4802298-Amphidinium_carterae.1
MAGLATSGFLGVVLAMTLCDEVRAYGFADTPGSANSPFHYYGDQKKGKANQNKIHHVAAEEIVKRTTAILHPATRQIDFV